MSVYMQIGYPCQLTEAPTGAFFYLYVNNVSVDNKRNGKIKTELAAEDSNFNAQTQVAKQNDLSSRVLAARELRDEILTV